MSKINIYFDEEGDFLEVGFGEPRQSYGEYLGDDTFEMRDRKTDEVIGYAFHNVSKRKKKPHSIEVEVPKAVL